MQQYFDYAANLTRTDITPSKKAAMTLFGNKYGYRPLKVIHDYSTGENIRKLKSLASEVPTSSHVYICVSYKQQVRIDYSYLVETKQHIYPERIKYINRGRTVAHAAIGAHVSFLTGHLGEILLLFELNA